MQPTAPLASSPLRLPEAKEPSKRSPLVAKTPTPQQSNHKVPVSPQRPLFEASFAPKRPVGEGRPVTAAALAASVPAAAAALPSAAPSASPAASLASSPVAAEQPAKGARPGVGQAYSEGELVSDQVFLGTVKSYNDRRGFGFLSCAETAAAYGRDVYIAKTEAQVAAAEASSAPAAGPVGGGKNAADLARGDKATSVPRLAEEDPVQFKVRLSVEGFPQAAQVLRLRKFRGVVMQAPAEASEGASEGVGRIASAELSEALGVREVAVRREACGQVRLAPGDEVTFCVPEAEAGQQREAQLVLLYKSPRPMGSVLGCFSLVLPRPCVSEQQQHQRPDLVLDCHAFGDKVILAGLPRDAEEGELSRFFSKQGATGAIVAHARGCSFASISFPSSSEVTKLLGRTAHAFADDKETRIAMLRPCRRHADGTAEAARLPALPAPTLTPCEEAGSLLVVWSPLVLAVGYSVELRPAGGQAPWAAVDVSAGRLGAGLGRFDPDCSSCKVNGLHVGTAYEARVTYFTSCGCRAEASDSSERCVPSGAARRGGAHGAAPAGNWSTQQAAPAAMPAATAPVAPGWPVWSGHDANEGRVGLQMPAVTPSVPAGEAALMSPLPAYLPSSGWRCAHGYLVPQPSQPELRPVDEFGFAISVQWPSVAHAAAYVVELREAGAATAERFIRSAPMAPVGSPVELRVGGLRPGGQPGRCYAAQIRCVAACGCESMPSGAGWSQPLGAAVPQAARPAPGSSCGTMTGSAPPQWGYQPQQMQQLQQPPQQQQQQLQQQHLQQQQQSARQFQSEPQFSSGGTTCSGAGLAAPQQPRSQQQPQQPHEMQVPAGTWTQTPWAGYQHPGMPSAPLWGTSPAAAAPAGGATADATADGPKETSGESAPAVPVLLQRAPLAPWATSSKEFPPEVTGQEECLILD